MANNDEKWAPQAVLVCGLPPETSGEEFRPVLRLHFENKELSGGGPIEKEGINLTDSKTEAVILFSSENDAKSVRQKMDQELDINGQKIKLEIIKCPIAIVMKYFKGTSDSSSDSSSDSFVLLENPKEQEEIIEESDCMRPNTKEESGGYDKNNDISEITTNLTPEIISSMTDIHLSNFETHEVPITKERQTAVPDLYVSAPILEIQKQQEAKYAQLRKEKEQKELKDQDNRNRSTVPLYEEDGQQHSSIEKAQYESSEKENPKMSNGDSDKSVTEKSMSKERLGDSSDSEEVINKKESRKPEYKVEQEGKEDTLEKTREGPTKEDSDDLKEKPSDQRDVPEQDRVLVDEFLSIEDGKVTVDKNKEKLKVQSKLQQEDSKDDFMNVDKNKEKLKWQSKLQQQDKVQQHEEPSMNKTKLQQESKGRDNNFNSVDNDEVKPETDHISSYNANKDSEKNIKGRENLPQSQLLKEKLHKIPDATYKDDKDGKMTSNTDNIPKSTIPSDNFDPNKTYELPKPLREKLSPTMLEPDNKNLRTVILKGITPDVNVDLVEVYFENTRKSGGGPLESLDFIENSQTASLVFEKKEYAENILSREHLIEGHKLEVMSPNILDDKSDCSSTDDNLYGTCEPIKIKVAGIKKGTSAEMLSLFFEHKRKCKGGDIASFELDAESGTALLIYKENEVAERVLAQKCVSFSGNEMTLTKIVIPVWDRKTVYVTDFGKLSEEGLELLYENKRKSGGGPVESVAMDEDRKGALVTFENESDAARVLEQGIVKRRDGVIIKASKPSYDREKHQAEPSKPIKEPVISRSITVLGLDENVTDDVLEMLFENEKHSGGGPVEQISIDVEFGMAVVTFEDYKVAERVLAKETISYRSLNLVIQPHIDDSEEKKQKEEIEEPHGAFGGATDVPKDTKSDTTSENRNRGRFNCIEVTGLSKNTSKEYVGLFFESSKNGGGDIEDISHNQEQGTAMITFKDESVTKSVLQKHHDTPLKIEGVRLDIRPIDTSRFAGSMPAVTSCAIEVKGIPVNSSEDTLWLFFENRRMCGGETVDEITYTAIEGRAVVTYRTTAVAQRVVEMHKNKPLHLEHALLEVRMLSSNSRPSQEFGPKEADTLFMKNLPLGADAEDIRTFLERVPNCKVKESVFGTTAGTVLIHFVHSPGYEKFYQLSCEKPLKGQMVDIESVSRSKSIEVYGVENITSVKLHLYFEHTKSKGGDVEQVDMLKEDNCAIVTFAKYGVAEKVLSKSDHVLERKSLIVRLHHECIGILPPNHDHTSPCAGIPSQVIIKQIDPDILGFVMSTASNRKYVQEAMKSRNGEIIWPAEINPDTEVIVKCTLHRTMPDLQVKIKNWEDDIQAIFREIMTNFIKDEVNVLQEAWQDFMKVSGDIKPENSDDVQVQVDHNACTVSALGKKNTVEQMMENFRQAIASIEEKLNRQRQIISEPVTNLKTYQIKFLLAQKFPQSTKQVFQDMKIDADMKQCKVTFTGIPSDIITAKLQMYELVSQMRYEKLHLSKPVCSLIKQKKTRDYMVSQFQERDCVIVTDVLSDTEVMVYAKTQEELTSGVAVVRSHIIENNIQVQEQSKGVMRTEKWKKLHDTLLKDNDGELKLHVSEDCSMIQIIVTRCKSDPVMESIRNFLKENTILETFIAMEKGTATLIAKESGKDLDQIERDFKSYSVSINRTVDESRPGLAVRGIGDGLEPAVTRVKMLAEPVVCFEHKINKPGMPKYFHEDRGKNVLHSLENRYRVMIVPGEKSSQKVRMGEFSSMAAAASKNEPKTKAKVSLSRGRTIHIVRGDITEYRVDAIVNAANERMEHVGGVAKAIVDKGGLAIQKECAIFTSTEGRLLPGQVYSSTAGTLPCKKVIHTVGPRWQGGYRNEENELFEAVYASLYEASNLRFQTIAIPAVSSGVYGFPKQKCCKIIFEAIQEFFAKERTLLNEVHLVDNNTDLVNAFHESAQNVFGPENVHDMDKESIETVLTQSTFGATQQMTGTSSTSSTPYWTKNGDKLTTPEGVTVKLVRGSIISQKADVAINTTNPELNLGSGGVSALILQAAGQTIQQECKQNAPGGVKSGDFVQTSGGNTSWKKIYHGSCPHYNGPQCIQMLKQFVQKCLTTAHSSGFSSIALPAIGTGNLKYPRNEVAQAMYEEVKVFSQKHRGTSLTQILFVVFDKDTASVKAFEAETERLKGVTSSTQRTTHNRRLARPGTGRSGFGSSENMMESYDQPDEGAASFRENVSLLSPGDVAQLHTEYLLITLVKGDITNQSTDAIVNSTNKELNFGSQVSKAILKTGGAEISRECARIGNTDKDHLAVTGAGNLNAKYIIHVEAPWDNFRYIGKWKERIGKVLRKADGLWCQSISFPALGTGTLNTKPSKMAAAMFEAFLEFGREANNLREIRVVVYEDRMINTFQEQLEKMGQKKKGFVEIIADAVQTLGGYLSGDFGDQYMGEVGGADEYMGAVGGTNTQYQRPRSSSVRQENIDPSVMTFQIYGFSQRNCDQVASALDKTCNDETQDKVLDSKDDQEIIKKLTDEQVKHIQHLEKTNYVKIKIDRGSRLCRIRIQGQHENVLNVMEKIYQIFREVEQAEREKSEAEYIAAQVQWQYADGSTFQTYPPEMNALIEKAYLKKESVVEFTELDEQSQPKVVRINLGTLEETEKGSSHTVKVRRYTSDSVELPPTWANMKKNQPFALYDLTAGSAEYNQIENTFSTSFQKGGSGYNSIIKIQRLQNPSMYQRYQVHKNHMEAANPPGTTNERVLWHGTADDTLDEINANGFNRSFCGKNGTAYGRGVYFATYTTLSSGYAKPNANGHKHMYMCRVLTGEFTTGNSSLLVPPPKDANKPNIKFDSVVDNTTNTKIYVVFQDTQSYPEYLITFN